MSAALSSIPKQSNINILFGQPITQSKTPIDINFQLDFFSKKHENNLFNLKQMLNINIQNDTFMIQLTSKNKYGTQLADKIQIFLSENKAYNKKSIQKSFKIKVLGKGNKTFILINSKQLNQYCQKLSSELQKVSFNKQEIDNSTAIKIQIRSSNSFSELRKLLDNQGAMRAAFNSLSVKLKFNKSKLVQQIINKFLKLTQQSNISQGLKIFNNVNLQLKFSSSQFFDKYNELKVFAQIKRKIQTYFFNAIKGLYQDQAKFYYFNKVFSILGTVKGQEIQEIIQALFGEDQKQK